MDIEIIEKIKLERQRYVDYFEDEINSLSKDKDSYAIELPIKTNDVTISAPFNIIRIDFITKDANNKNTISELRLDRLLDYPIKRLLYKNLQINFNPFCWNSCEFLVDKINIKNLKDWVNKWLKIDEEMPNEKISEAIHSCSEPEMFEDKFSFVIDFGTAKETAFIDFIDFLNDTGSTEMIIQTTEI